MKKYLLISAGFACILASVLMTTGCGSYYSTGYSDGYYDSNYGHGYGDGQQGNNNYYVNNQRPLGFNDFYHQLSPHGSWINMAPYGQVWVANVPNFQPYSTNGYWAYTTYGWTWVSNYSWGWAPFHYGRWGFNNRFGWYWVPGYEWGPAWVVWGSGANSMYGWAPLMPGMNHGVSLSINLFPSNYWTFMPSRYMGMNNIGNHFVNRSQNVTIVNNITIINNYGTENSGRYSMGPSAADVQRQTGRTVQQMRVTNVSDNSRSGVSDNESRVYRPVTRSADTSSDSRSATVSSDNSRTSDSSSRTQSTTQQSTNTQTRSSQPATQQSTNTQTRSSQPAQQDAGQRYQQSPAQPRVTNNAAPQTSRQIQAAQQENSRTQQQQQQRSATSSSSSTSTSRSGSNSNSNTNTQSRR